jgi:hypothetical protein
VATDEIVLAILWQVMEHLISHFCCIFRAYQAYGYIPTAWRQVKDMFISGPRKSDYTQAKACHPISLSSFPLEGNVEVGG